MTNTNCLRGVKCPNCGNDDRFFINAVITCFVTDEGSEPNGDHFWDDDSFTVCPECEYQGELRRYRP